eukprot:scaffold5741_cov114-Isochrysis_galbana.AAC.5
MHSTRLPPAGSAAASPARAAGAHARCEIRAVRTRGVKRAMHKEKFHGYWSSTRATSPSVSP